MIKQGNEKVNRILYRGTDDVARAVLGGDWRMPTILEIEELINNTNFDLVVIEGNNCIQCTSKKNGKYIILPLGGAMVGANKSNIGVNGSIWSSSNPISSKLRANYLLYRGDSIVEGNGDKYVGRNIRAVSETKGIDLGLPSGIRWAECNVGATQPHEYGNYFAWGELSPKRIYSWQYYKFNPSGDEVTITKYNSTDGLTTLELDCECEFEKVMQGNDTIFFKPIEYTKNFINERLSLVSACAVLDALQPITTAQTITFSAYTTTLINDSDVALGKVFDAIRKGWSIVGDGLIQTDDVAFFNDPETRIPILSEIGELQNNCDFSETIIGTNVCFIVTSRTNGNSIIIPKCGDSRGPDTRGFLMYWTSTKSSNTIAYRMLDKDKRDGQYKYIGMPIRAVSETKGIDLGLPSGLKWMPCNVGATQPHESGNFYAWGELAPKSSYTWANYKFNPSGDGTTFTKYNSTDGLTTLQIKY